MANRRWYDQALGDQNLLTVHDGQFGLIAGPSVQEHQAPIQLPLNDYPEADIRVCSMFLLSFDGKTLFFLSLILDESTRWLSNILK